MERINRYKCTKECEKRNLDTLEQDRAKVQEQIDNYTKEISLLHNKKQTRKVGLRIQSLNGIRGVLSIYLFQEIVCLKFPFSFRSFFLSFQDFFFRY